MKGIRYLFLTTVKNTIKDLKNNPGKLVLVVLFVVLIGITIASSFAPAGMEGQEYRKRCTPWYLFYMRLPLSP